MLDVLTHACARVRIHGRTTSGAPGSSSTNA
jgi:hypothetical protein